MNTEDTNQAQDASSGHKPHIHDVSGNSAHRHFKENPRVLYPNGECLSRPLKLPDSNRMPKLAIIFAACAIALIVLYFYFDATVNEPKREQATLEAELNKNISLDLPNLLAYLNMTDEQISAELKEQGYTLFDRRTIVKENEYEITKLPSDISLEEAAALYAIGLNKLSASQAVSVLNGSWVLNIDRKNGINIAVHYADFKNRSIEKAIQSAVETEKLDEGGFSDSGEDDGMGNAYTNGTITVDDKEYSWTVSAVPLIQVYSLYGIPDDAIYIGIRIKSI